jgi:hypothetical protein
LFARHCDARSLLVPERVWYASPVSIPLKLRSFIDKHGVTSAASAATLAGIALLLTRQHLPVSFAATALVLACASEIVRRLVPRLEARVMQRWPGFRARSARFLPFLVVALVTLWLLGPVALGQMPASQDHASHYLSTDILVHDMVGHGRLFGWTERLGAGYPYGDLYHTFSYLVTGAAHLLSFRLIPLDVSYAIGISIVWLVVALSVARLAERLGNGWAAAFAGLAAAADPGADREGGWGYGMFHGVWTQQLGVGLWLFAILALWRLTERADTRRLCIAGLLCGAALLAHPINTVCLFVAGALMVVVRLIAVREAPSRGVLRLIAALALGGTIAMGFIVRMSLYGGFIRSIPVYWSPLPEIMGAALTRGPFENQPAFIGVLGMIGVAYALYARDLFARYVVLLAGLLLAIGSMDLVLGLDLGLSGGVFRLLQYRRLAIPLKSLFFALAGVGFWVVCRGITSAARAGFERPWAGSVRVVSAIAIAPSAYALVYALPYLREPPTARALTLRRAGELEHTRAIENLLRAEASRLPPGAPRRAVYIERAGHGGRYPTLAIADAGFGLLPNLLLPAQNFGLLARTNEPDLMHRLGASMLITRWPIQDPLLERVAVEGAHSVYRFTKAPASPVEIEGPGRVEVTSWNAEEKRLRLTGVAPATRLILALSPYPKWRARQGSRELALTTHVVRNVPLIAIQAPSDGDLVLEYRELVREKLAGWMCFAVFLLCCAGAALRSKAPFKAPSEPILGRLYQALGAATLAGCVTFALAALVRGKRAEADEWLAGEPSGSELGEILHLKHPDSIAFEPQQYCTQAYSRNPGWGCSEAELRPLLSAGPVRNDRVPSCLLVGVPPLGKAAVGYDVSGAPPLVKGRLHAADPDGKISGSLSFDGETPAPELPSEDEFRLPIPGGTKRLTFTLENRADQPMRVCLEAALIEKG